MPILIRTVDLALQFHHIRQGILQPLGILTASMSKRGRTDTLVVTMMTTTVGMIVEELGMVSMTDMKEGAIITMDMRGNDTIGSVI